MKPGGCLLRGQEQVKNNEDFVQKLLRQLALAAQQREEGATAGAFSSVLGQGPGARKTSMGRCKLARNGFDLTIYIYLTLSNDFQESFGGYSVEIRVTNEIHDDLQSYILWL